MLKLRNVSKIYQAKEILKNISLELPSRGFVFIIGKSDSEKSTLLNIIGGLDSPSNGEIYYKDKLLDLKNSKVANNYRLNEMGFIFQYHNLLCDKTIFENIACALKIKGQKTDATQISNLLNFVGLNGFELKNAKRLYKIDAIRIALARALYKEAKIILVDDPTQNLEKKDSQVFYNLLKKVSQNTLVVVVTNNCDLANKYGDRIIELEAGVIINDQTVNILADVNEYESIQVNKVSLFYIVKSSFNLLPKQVIRNILTLILTFISIIAFSLSIAFLFKGNSLDILLNNLKENQVSHVYLENKKDYPNFTVDTYKGDEFAPLYVNKSADGKGPKLFWAYHTVEVSNFDKFNLQFIHGTSPKTYAEIVITDYIAENTLLEYNDRYASIEELIGEKFIFGFAGLKDDIELEVSGIIKTKYKKEGEYTTGDYLFRHYYVKSGFFEYYREKILYGEGVFYLKSDTKEFDSFMFRDNKTPSVTISKNPSLLNSDIKVITETGVVNIQEVNLADNEIIINLNYYNYLFREEDDYLTKENIFDKLPEFNETIKFTFYDTYSFGRERNIVKTLKVKGIIYDSKNEPIKKPYANYNFASLCLIISDNLFNNIVQYYMPVKYLIDISSPRINEILNKYYPYVNKETSSDKIQTVIDLYLNSYLSTLNDTKISMIIMSVILTFITWLLIYHNAKNNVEGNMGDIGILYSLGISKKHVIFLFLNESLILFTLIFPSTLISINAIFNALNKSNSYNEYFLNVLYFNFKNLPIIILYIIGMIFLPLIIFIVKYMKKTLHEI